MVLPNNVQEMMRRDTMAIGTPCYAKASRSVPSVKAKCPQTSKVDVFAVASNTYNKQ